MKLIKPSWEILSINGQPGMIEHIGRTCYKSEDKITDDSAKPFVGHLLSRGHESVLEHSLLTVKFICDRGVSHELVRHRLASFTQESTRYCNYSKGKFDGEITYIIPPWVDLSEGPYQMTDIVSSLEDPGRQWLIALNSAEGWYMYLLSQGWKPEQARSVLPNALKTEIVVSANFREWRHIFKLRTSPMAHPQMRELMVPLLEHLKQTPTWGVFFEDL